jgi:DNA-binding NarL/FixJ family response regulator
MSASPIRVLIADDHPIVRQGLGLVISVQPDMVLVGEATNGLEAVELAGRQQPDVVVLDLLMPLLDGNAAIPQMLRLHPHMRILVLTSLANDERLLAALQAGATGCMVKDAAPSELLQAIRSVARGERALHPVVTQQLIRRLERTNELQSAAEPLTTREIDVLRCLAQGLANKAIADQLHISVRTVHAHIRTILDKLQLENRTQAALYAREHGLE